MAKPLILISKIFLICSRFDTVHTHRRSIEALHIVPDFGDARIVPASVDSEEQISDKEKAIEDADFDLSRHFRLMNDIDSEILRVSFLRLYRHARKSLRKLHKAMLSVLDRNHDGRLDLLDFADYRRALRKAWPVRWR